MDLSVTQQVRARPSRWLLFLAFVLAAGLVYSGVHFAVALLLTALFVAVGMAWQQQRMRQRVAFIESYVWPHDLWQRVETHARSLALSAKQRRWVERGLRDFFQIQTRSNSRQVMAMPSHAVDALWHALILDTRAYAEFCQRAFGRMLHHRPHAAIPQGDAAMMRTWQSSCQLQGLTPQNTTVLPRLFMLDAMLLWPQMQQHDALEWSQRYRQWVATQSSDSGSSHSSDHDSSDSHGCGGDSGCSGGCGGD